MLRDAAAADTELRSLWNEIASRTQEAADVVWAMNSPEFFLLLVHERRWSGERFERWLTDAWALLLLPPDGR